MFQRPQRASEELGYTTYSESVVDGSCQSAQYQYKNSNMPHGTPKGSKCYWVTIYEGHEGNSCPEDWPEFTQLPEPPEDWPELTKLPKLRSWVSICNNCDKIVAHETPVEEADREWKISAETGEIETLTEYEERLRRAACATFAALDRSQCGFEAHTPSSTLD